MANIWVNKDRLFRYRYKAGLLPKALCEKNMNTLLFGIILILIGVGITTIGGFVANDGWNKIKNPTNTTIFKANKPLLSINYKKFKNGSNIQIIKSEDSIYVSFKFVIKNIGNALANNIQLSKLIPGNIQNIDMNLDNADPGNMSLGPSDPPVVLDIGFTYIPDDKKAIDKSYENFNTGNYEVGLGLFYENEYDSNNVYLRKFAIKVNQKDITIENYEAKVLNNKKP